MSEYQYYEFQTVEKTLTKEQKQEISQLSSRVQVTGKKAIFIYNYGDFRGNPEDVLIKYFDAMFYLANWGTIQLMFRFSLSQINLENIVPYCLEDFVTIKTINNHIILNIELNNEEGFGWVNGEGSLDSLIDLRQEILEQDYRLLYLAWLKGINHLDLEPSTTKPPIPKGLAKLSPSLEYFVELFEIDKTLSYSSFS